MMLGPLIIDLKGVALDNEEQRTLLNPLVGGVILFSRNYESVKQLFELTGQIRQCRPDIVIAVDQEGGRVQRFRSGFSRLPSLQKLGRLYAENKSQARQATRDLAWLMAVELLAFNIDISFAPVVDADDHSSDVIGDRSFSVDPNVVAELGQAYIEGMHDAGMAATLKHFPGHGHVKADSHVALATDTRRLEEIEQADLIPFKRLLAQAQAVMPAHICFPEVDQTCVGFSQVWLQTILREKLQFDGVVFSDDLSMEGASLVGDHIARANAALTAGCDAILLCNKPELALDVLHWLEQAQWQGTGRLERLLARRDSQATSFDELKQSQRWQEASAWLGLLEVL